MSVRRPPFHEKIICYIGLDVDKETIVVELGNGPEGNRYTRCARPAEPESVGCFICRNPG